MPKQPTKDRCFLIPAKNGLGFIKVQAAKKPTGKSLEAMQELFDAAESKYRGKITRDFSMPRAKGGGPGVKAKGLYPEVSRTKVARLLNCDPSTVTGYLAGRTKMPLERALKFAKLAGIPVETLQRDLSRAQEEFAGK